MRALRLLGLALLVSCAARHVEVERREPVSGRSYRVLLPRAEQLQPTAALFLLHAYATSPDTILRAHRLTTRVVDARGWLLVVPEGEPDAAGQLAWNASAACCGEGPARRQRDDLGYLRAVLADVRAHFAVDPRRVYALGISNGSFMAQRWACAPGSGLRAVISIAGAAPGPSDPACTPDVPLSMLHVHGTGDSVIRYAGGADYPGARATAELWRKLAGAPSTAHTRWRHSWLLERVREDSWTGAARVALWSYQGAGHPLRSLRFETGALLDFLEP